MNKGILTISCPDTKGIVHAITGFLFEHNGNIITLEQHIERETFFMRVEWDLDGFKLRSKDDFNRAFEELNRQYQINLCLDYQERKKRLGLFCSKDPHCVIDILSRQATGELSVEIPFVISNFSTLKDMVAKFGLSFFHIPTTKGLVTDAQGLMDHEKMQLTIMQQYPTDFIGFARYMKIVSARFIQDAAQPIINVHHSFLPSFIGANPYEEAYERGVKLIGATAHYVTKDLDQGPIIEQDIKRISHIHTVSNLKLMGRESEKQVFAFAIKKHIENKIIPYQNRCIIFE